MKLARLAGSYPAYLRQFYSEHPELERASFAEQKRALDHDAFGWGDAWVGALAPHGYEMLEVRADVGPLQRAWAREQGRGLAGTRLEAIALEQVRAFAPDVLWFDHHDAALLAAIRERVPSVRRVMGWAGSHLPAANAWRGMDAVLSCSAASVETLRARGLRAELLRHAFDDRVRERLAPGGESLEVVFVGQFDPDAPTHARRERLIERLLGEVNLAVFSPSRSPGIAQRLKLRARALAWDGLALARRVAGPGVEAARIPILGRAAAWPARPRPSLPGALARALRPARFGLAMYRTLRAATIVLDVQADEHASDSSNMRLFEATGVGACLLTDRTRRLGELFEPDREVATYGDADECVATIRRLLANASEREAIARAGERRTLGGHTFRHRAGRLDELIRGVMA